MKTEKFATVTAKERYQLMQSIAAQTTADEAMQKDLLKIMNTAENVSLSLPDAAFKKHDTRVALFRSLTLSQMIEKNIPIDVFQAFILIFDKAIHDSYDYEDDEDDDE